MQIQIVSFGFKHGAYPEVDLLFDVRFLPNPYYIPELKETTGLFPKTSLYAIGNNSADDFFRHLSPLLDFLIKQYNKINRDHLTIGIGCTGGKHRSVAVAENLLKRLAAKNYQTSVHHRDISKH